MTKSEEILQLQKRIKELEERLELKNKLEFLLEESIPEGQGERRKYMSSIALFYSSTFKEKLKHFIGDQLEELAQIGRTELGTNIIRSNINCFRLIDDWLKEKTNEHLGNLQEVRESLGENGEFINEMKQKYD
mgnify:CR=1 FL=1|tara:strand:- start:1563 stop:1961 length:399 start_codon:yes stop_codon:yes gene_type:complete